MSNEPLARQYIDDQLKDVGWNLKDPNNVQLEARETESGICDYILKDDLGRPLAVVEAKKKDYPLLSADKQAKDYALGWKVDFLFLANGEEIYFWDYKNHAYPKKINSFFSQNDLTKKNSARIMIKPLDKIEVDNKIVNRKYQIECINLICQKINKGDRSFLIEMATGTGKTRLSIALIKKLFKSNQISRVLFISDRDNLRVQTTEAFLEFLPETSCYSYSGGSFKTEKKITIATYQSLLNNYDKLTAGYYDLILVDECHRSIYGKFRHILDHFYSIKIGLTATPYVSSEELVDDSEDSFIIKDTLKFFELDEPTYKYRLKDAIRDGYLTPYSIYKAKTIKTSDEEGIPINLDEVDFSNCNEKEKKTILELFGEKKQIKFDLSQLERKISIPKRNEAIVEEFRNVILYGNKNYKEDNRPTEGKTIVFAVTQSHAIKLAKLLDSAFSEKKDKPSTRYADFVISTQEDSETSKQKIRDFKKKKFPKILVSVGMLDTGFDCEEVTNLVFVRHVKSNVLYQQMRGRGARLCPEINKERFWIFDFAGVTDLHKDKENDENIGSLVSISSRKKKNTIKKLIEFPVDDWIDPYSREEIEYDEKGNIKKSEEKNLKSKIIKSKFEGWFNGMQDLDYNKKKTLRVISQYLQANSDKVNKLTLADFTYPPFEGVEKVEKIFENKEKLEKYINSINLEVLK